MKKMKMKVAGQPATAGKAKKIGLPVKIKPPKTARKPKAKFTP